MAWERIGDTATSHPVYMAGAVVDGADSRTQAELFGHAVALGSRSAAHAGDGIVDRALLLAQIGHSDVDRVTGQLVQAGYLVPVDGEGPPRWRLINDPKFIHIRNATEVRIDRARKAESRSGVRLLVQLRDGSRCRYCGKTGDERDTTGGRLLTVDHRDPAKLRTGQPITSPHEAVVACRPCNSSRGAADRDGRIEQWDAAHPLWPVPEKPHYSDHLRKILTEQGLLAEDTAPGPVERPATDTAPAAVRPGNQPDTARRGARPATAPAPAPGVRPDATQHDPPRPPGGDIDAKTFPPNVAQPAGGARPTPNRDRAMGGQPGRGGPGRAGSGGRRRRGRRRKGEARQDS